MDYTLFILTFVSVSLLPGLCMSLAFSLGLSLGYKNTLWMIFGELVGLALVVLCCALGIEFILRYENLFKFFQIAGALYLLYIAFILFKSKSQITQEKIIHKKKFSLIIQGFIASSSNPKAWIFMFSILPSFLKFQVNVNILLLIILLIEFYSLSLYALGGSIFKIFMNKHLDKINKISALFIFAMALSVLYKV
ncbi:LysE family translocator [Campylobacter coli]|uniref:LysE family translocator n=1 Tax=Campylobacter coli TaxID=195 RepID=UPI00148333F5|nr:LysE family translocator [Campylobacter coli]EGT1673555.1 LysE family translocator [Campylobacter coli]ELS4838968.1 LysE family translocator [Campylobacter coli]UYU13775.1 LysE family translocator [Campylobacter coli]UYU15607.1 LysE family translocator [Campylobacter coli]